MEAAECRRRQVCTPAAFVAAALLAASRAIAGGQVDVDAQDTAEAAYSWQRKTAVKLRGELAEFLGHPRWPCFWGEEITSDGSGKYGSGAYGYRTCGLRRLLETGRPGVSDKHEGDSVQRPCIIYSFGCDGDYEFERSIATMHGTNCEIHIFDPMDPEWRGEDEKLEVAFADLPVLVSFHRLALLDSDKIDKFQPWPHAAAVSMPTYTLPSIMKMLGHTHVDVLKIDIEGSEHRALAYLAEHGWPSVPGQVYMEVHASPEFPPYDAPHLRRLVASLESAGLRLFNAERPWRWCQSSCMQFSFIHRDWRPGTGGYPATGPWLGKFLSVRHLGHELNYEFLVNGSSEPKPKSVFVRRPTMAWPTVAPGAWFSVQWNAQNVGTEPFLAGCCSFIMVDGTDGWMDATGGTGETFTLSGDIAPQQYLTVHLELAVAHTRPSAEAGRLQARKEWSRWQLQTRAGTGIGSVVEIAVFVASGS